MNTILHAYVHGHSRPANLTERSRVPVPLPKRFLIGLGLVLLLTSPCFADLTTLLNGDFEQAENNDVRKTYHVRDWGAIPDDQTDDTQAIQDCINDVRTKPGATISFEPGIYNIRNNTIYSKDNLRNCIDLNECKDLRLNGNGATLQYNCTDKKDFAKIFRIDGCSDIMIKGFTMYWWPSQMASATVIAKGPTYIDFQLDDGYSVVPGFAVKRLLRYLRTGDHLFDVSNFTAHFWPDDTWWTLTVLDANQRKIRVAIPSAQQSRMGYVSVNDCYVISYAVYGYDAFSVDNCTNVTIRDCITYGTGGMALHASHSENIAVINYDVVRRPGMNWYMTCTADGFNLKHNRGDLLIQDCDIQYQGDDGVNIHGAYIVVQSKVASNRVRARFLNVVTAPIPGDTIEFIAPNGITTDELRTVSSCSRYASRDYDITFASDVPAATTANYILANRTWVPSKSTIKNNRFFGNRGYGIRLQTRNCWIQNNVFSNMTGPAIFGVHQVLDARFFESIQAKYCYIEDNTFASCPRNANGRSATIVFQSSQMGSSSYCPAGCFYEIYIRKNRFLDISCPLISAKSISRLHICDNDFEGVKSGVNAIDVDYYNNSEITGNRFTPSTGAIIMGPHKGGTNTVSNNANANVTWQ